MNCSQIRLITFDVTNTLIRFKINPAKQYGKIGAKFGILCDSHLLAKNFKIHWQKMSTDHPNFGFRSGLGWEQWWKQIIIGTFQDSKLNIENDKLTDLATHLIEIYKTYTCWQHCSGVLDLLSYLRHKGIVLGVISNFDPRLNQTLQNAQLHHYFKFIISSYNIGVEKPNKKIFQTAIELSAIDSLKPEQCLHIGDDLNLDYFGAKNAGWNAILIHNETNNKIKLSPKVNRYDAFPTLFDLHRYFIENIEGSLVNNVI